MHRGFNPAMHHTMPSSNVQTPLGELIRGAFALLICIVGATRAWRFSGAECTGKKAGGRDRTDDIQLGKLTLYH